MADEEQLRKAVVEASRDGRAACKALLELARRTGASPARIGELCDEMNIRICACQLGCFD